MLTLMLALLCQDDLRGTWKLTEATLGGAKLPDAAIAPLRLELGDGTYALTGAESPDKGTIAVDAKKKSIDVTGTDGPNKGKTFPAIYELKGDVLRICYDLSGKKRPSEFKSAKGTQEFLVAYKRDK